MKNVLPILALLFAAILVSIYSSSCGFINDPVAFVSATPPTGSTLQQNATITLTFDAEPIGLKVSGGTAVTSGRNAIISGPFTPGKLALTLTWDDGTHVLNYTIEGEANSNNTAATSKPEDPTGEEPEDPPTDPTLILSLSFDGLAGHRVIDQSQHGNDGLLVGNPQLVKGVFGNALEFNGSTDWVEVPHDDSLTVDKDVTVMAWIRTPRHNGPGGANWQGIIAKGNNPRSYSFYTEVGGSVHLSVGNFQGSDSNRKVKLNAWQHVVAQIDNGVHRYWINGVNAGNFDVDAELPGGADRAAVLIGNTHEDSRMFLGLIDEVRIWNRALSEAEILEQAHK